MRIVRTQMFINNFEKLPKEIKQETKQSIRFLVDNLFHPSLRAKKIKGSKDIWEASITMKYRFTFKIESDVYVLRNIGTHSILKNP